MLVSPKINGTDIELYKYMVYIDDQDDKTSWSPSDCLSVRLAVQMITWIKIKLGRKKKKCWWLVWSTHSEIILSALFIWNKGNGALNHMEGSLIISDTIKLFILCICLYLKTCSVSCWVWLLDRCITNDQETTNLDLELFQKHLTIFFKISVALYLIDW